VCIGQHPGQGGLADAPDPRQSDDRSLLPRLFDSLDPKRPCLHGTVCYRWTSKCMGRCIRTLLDPSRSQETVCCLTVHCLSYPAGARRAMPRLAPFRAAPGTLGSALRPESSTTG
jgi:hypothetical protein